MWLKEDYVSRRKQGAEELIYFLIKLFRWAYLKHSAGLGQI